MHTYAFTQGASVSNQSVADNPNPPPTPPSPLPPFHTPRTFPVRNNIRDFKSTNSVGGHTTVIWSGSVEPNSPLVSTISSVSRLLRAFECDDDEERGGVIPPSLIYATAAVLEGCR